MRNIISILILLSIAVTYTAHAQVILPLATGQKNSINVICSSNDKFYVVTKTASKYEIMKWDGNFWINSYSIPQSYFDNLSSAFDSIAAKSICRFKNETYVAFTNINNGKLLIIKSKDKGWEKINTENFTAEKNLEFLNSSKDLLLCGNITANNVSVSIIKIENEKCTVYAPNPPDQGISDYFTDFEYSDNKIWAIGLFATPFDPYNKSFKVFENNTWKSITNSPYNNGFEGFGKYNDSLIVTGVDFDGYINFSIKSNNWKEISNGMNEWKVKSVSDIHQVKNLLWVAGRFENIKTGKFASIACWNGNLWTIPSLDYIGNDLQIAGENEIYLSGSFLNHQGLLLNKTGKIEIDKGLLAGKVFFDNNQNCTQEIDENNLQGVYIKILPENIYVPTDFNGNYTIPVDTKITQHLISVEAPKYHISTCGTKIINHNGQNTNAGIDFGILSYGSHNDISIKLSDFTGWRARQGFDEFYQICVTNKGTQNIDELKIEFTPDDAVNFTEFSIIPNENTGKSYIWKILNLKKGESILIKAKANIPVELKLDEKIRHFAKVSIIELNDEDITNNFDTLTQKIVAAIDPNDKNTKQEYKITPQTNLIDYKIRFQNTGNDTAYNIQVIDTLDPNFAISMHGVYMSSSHKYELAPVAWLQNGKYRYKYAWIFRDILLPDKNTNNELSQGFIDFNINLSDKLEIGTYIKNKAYIYFDFQEPVITNDAINLVSNSTNTLKIKAGKITVLPNPAHNYLSISNAETNEINISIKNILGQTLIINSIPRKSAINIDISKFNSGIYFLQAEGFLPIKFIKN
ncbi:MAG: T9SS type A sorting domain-containing protein [Bacteroidetes bacterium]|nr:T9SS type A sorting domain-containing protein [Bacteroidota bacterium]